MVVTWVLWISTQTGYQPHTRTIDAHPLHLPPTPILVPVSIGSSPESHPRSGSGSGSSRFGSDSSSVASHIGLLGLSGGVGPLPRTRCLCSIRGIRRSNGILSLCLGLSLSTSLLFLLIPFHRLPLHLILLQPVSQKPNPTHNHDGRQLPPRTCL